MKVHRGRWTLSRQADRKADMFYVSAAEETIKGGRGAFVFGGTRRELQELRTALAAALTATERPSK